MGFQGYKLQFELHASHRSNHSDASTSHMHTFRITLFLKDNNGIMDLYQDVEKVVGEQLAVFQNCDLDEMNMFKEDTTVEGIGSVLFDVIKSAVQGLSFQLVRLEIGDSPVRCFSVSDELLDGSVNLIPRMPYLKMDEMSGSVAEAGREYNETASVPAVQPEESVAVSAEKDDKVQKRTKAIGHPISETPKGSKGDYGQNTNQDDGRDQFVSLISEGEKKRKDKAVMTLQFLASLGLLVVFAGIIVYMIAASGAYPRGSDTFNHMFRGRMVYEGIQEGNYYLLFTEKWYNGIEIMRYWSPIPLYAIAGCIALAGGDILNGYLVLIGMLILIGGIGWLLVGVKQKRIWVGLIIGIIWFLLPDNMRILFNEGNIPRTVAGVLLPYLFLCIHEFTEKEKWGYLFPTAFLTAMIALCHLMIAAMVGITVFVYLVVHSIVSKKIVPQILMLMGMVLSFTLIGVWLYGALQGGFMEMSAQGTSQVMKIFFADGFRSLNPSIRFSGDQVIFYFGLAMFVIAVAGCFFGKKESVPGFVTVLFLFFSTTNSMYELYSRLPFHQFFWMIRFIPVGLAAAMLAFLLWKGLKKWVVILMLILLFTDCSSSLCYLYVPKADSIQNVRAEEYERAEKYGILQAKALTNQRMAIFDLSEYGAFAAYMVSGVAPEKNYTFGWAWQGAETAENLVALNDAYSEAFYLYLFDRSLELGNDVLLMKKDLMELKDKPSRLQEMMDAGEQSGYYLAGEGEEYFIFKLDCEYDSFGLVSKYKGLAIGSSARDMTKLYPGFEEAASDNLDEYTTDELKEYQTIYLSGFQYTDKKHMEDMLKELSDLGVQVVVNMNHIPEENSLTGNDILGVTAHPITFKGTYPLLNYREEDYVTRGFGAEDTVWSTMYLNGLDVVTGYANLEGKVLDFAGTKTEYPNVTFLGYNLVYHVLVTKDEQVGIILDDLFGMSRSELPEREIVPVTIVTTPYHITVTAPTDEVNTTLACYDIFKSDRNITNRNHLLYVDEGVTDIRITVPYLKEGLIVSSFGCLLFIAFAYISYKIMKNRNEDDRKNLNRTEKH